MAKTKKETNMYLLLKTFLVAVDLCCCTRAFSNCGERGYSLVAEHRLLYVTSSSVAENRL